MGVKPGHPCPDGYKQTEVGVIPEDWNVQPLRSLAHFKTGPFGTLLKADEYSATGGAPLISVRDIGADGFLHINEKTPRVPVSVVRRLPEYVLNIGDIVFGRKGAVDRSAMVNDFQNGWFLGSDGIRLRPLSGCHPRFIAYELQRSDIRGWLMQHATGTTMASLNQEILSRISIPQPPMPEQHAIVETLSDVDALIGSLDRLIAKKRDLKQAAMQQLLTGQTRLPGFSGEWEVKKIGELLDYERPDKYLVQSTDYQENAQTPVLTANKTFLLGYTSEDYGIYYDLPVIIFDDFTTDSKYVISPFKVKSSAIKILKNKSAVTSLKFIYERMRLIQFPLGEHKRYYISEYQHLKIPMPKKEEQTAIASVLSDMDAEIAALEAHCDKTRALKQGMMQELLTGSIRLI